MLYKFRRAQNSFISGFGFDYLLMKNRPGKRLIIYHGVDDVGEQKFNSRFISKDVFDQQIAYFCRHFKVVSLQDYYQCPPDPNKLTIALSFDDGYHNHLTHVLPVLERYQAPASFFVTGVMDTQEDILWADILDIITYYYESNLKIDGDIYAKDKKNNYICLESGKSLKQLCKQSDWDFKYEVIQTLKGYITKHQLESTQLYWRQLAPSDIQELSISPLVTIGSHGYYHNNLAEIDVADAESEIVKSKLFLENIIQKPINSIAFPCGSYSQDILKICHEHELHYQLADKYLSKDDINNSALCERFGVNPYIDFPDQISCILRGSYY